MHQDTDQERLEAWLHELVPSDIGIAWLESFDVSAYLNETEALDILPAERLRKLCIFLGEERYAALLAEYPRSWQALQRVFDQAHKLAPQDAVVLVSNAITAMQFAKGAEYEKHDVALYGIAKELLKRALDIESRNSHALYAMGLCEYDGPGGSERARNALPWFERACDSDPGNSWAQLYRAHCLHDMEEWDDAVVAYEAVDRSAFTGPTSWRSHKLVEQLALCRLYAGDRNSALHEFREALRFYSGLSEEEFIQHPYPEELLQAASGPLRDELGVEVLALAKLHDWQDAIERLEIPAK